MLHLGRRTVPALTALALLAACGGDDSSSTPADADRPTEEAGETSGGDGGSSEGAGGTGTGYVEIGAERFEFTIDGCISAFGAVAGNGVGVEDPDNTEVAFDFAPDDWRDRPASEGWESDGAITVRSEEPYLQWETGGEVLASFNLPAGIDAADLTISSYEIDEGTSTVTGEAVFLEVNAVMAGTAAEPTEGSFELSCPSEG